MMTLNELYIKIELYPDDKLCIMQYNLSRNKIALLENKTTFSISKSIELYCYLPVKNKTS